MTAARKMRRNEGKNPYEAMAWSSDPAVRGIYDQIDDRELDEIAESIMEFWQGSDEEYEGGEPGWVDPTKSFEEPRATDRLTREEAVEATTLASRIVDWANYGTAYNDYSNPPWEEYADPGLEPNAFADHRKLAEETTDPASLSYSDVKEGKSGWSALDVPVFLIAEAGGSDYSGGLVYRSNYEVILEKANEDEEIAEHIISIYGGHGSYGIAIRLDRGKVPEELIEIVESLSKYPLLDEDHHSHMEMEAEDEAWKDYGRNDWRKALINANEDFEEYLEEVDDAKLDEMWHEARQHLSWDVEHEEGYGGGTIFNFKEAVKLVEIEDDE